VLAERELARRGLKVELVKAGMQGLDTRSEFILLRRLIDRYDADAVVVGFLINDLYTNLPYAPRTEAQTPSPDLEQVQRSVFRQRSTGFHLLTLARRIASATDAAYIGLYLAAPGRGEYLRPPLSAKARRQLEITDTLFSQLAAYCRSKSTPLTVFSLPQQFQVMYARRGARDQGVEVSYYDQHFGRLAPSWGLDWIPALDEMTRAEQASGQDMFYRLDGHFSPAGHRVAAEVFTSRVIPALLARLKPHGQGAGQLSSKNRIDKGREHRSLGEHQQHTHQK
jgi:hypothetical protein